MANMNDVKNTVELVLLSGKVPTLVGSCGIGKTQIMKEVANEMNLKLITVEMSLLKDGEIGGLPIVTDKKENGRVFKTTEYAIHHKIKEMNHTLTLTKDGKEMAPDKSNAKYDGVLLFLDEINRSSFEVMQESMNIILNRNINGFDIPEDVYVTAAMNPSKAGGANGSYQTNELDDAQLDRLTIIDVTPDAKNWLEFATDNKFTMETHETGREFVPLDKTVYKTNIHNEIIEFISADPSQLNTIGSPTVQPGDVFATPRSWEFASDILRTYELNKNNFGETHLGLALKGTIGQKGYLDFTKFSSNNKNPLIPAAKFFEGKTLNKAVIEEFKDQSDSRQYLMAKSCMQTLSEANKLTKNMKERYMDIIQLLPSDRMVALLRYTKNNYIKLHDKLMDEERYYKTFLDLISKFSN